MNISKLFAVAALPLLPVNVYVSETPKGAVSHFLSRYATPRSQIVLTREAVPSPYRSHVIEIAPGEMLLTVTRLKSLSRAVAGEKFRIGDLSFVAATPSLARTLEQDTDLNVERVPSRDAYFPQYPSILTTMSTRTGAPKIVIDPAFLKQKLSELSGAVPTTVGGKTVTIAERGSVAGRELARAWLAEEYQKLGYKVSLHRYAQGAANFIAERAGSDPSKFVIYGSHLDSVNNAGADDNGSGTITGLAIARALAGAPLKFSYRVVAFDQEELGLVGSTRYARALSDSGQMKGLIGVFAVDMDGYNSRGDGAFHVIDCKENTSADLTARVMRAVTELGLPIHRVEACTNRSDHASFWKYGIPSVVTSENFFGGDSNKCYHKACDQVGLINFEYMARLVTAQGTAIAGLIAE